MTAELLEWELNGKLRTGGLESRPGSPTTEQLKEIEDQWQEVRARVLYVNLSRA